PNLVEELSLRGYLFVGAAGLLLFWMGLSEDFGILALVPVLAGAGGLAVFLLPPTWHGLRAAKLQRASRSLPILVLTALVVLELLRYWPWPVMTLFETSDLLMAAGLVTYFAAQYRIFGLRVNVVPTDLRTSPDRL